MKRILLASGSPRRKMLLEWAEIKFEVAVSNADESFSPSLSPEEAATFIARQKNQAVVGSIQKDLEKIIVLSADTIVVLDNEIIGKPIDQEEAIAIIQKLSGKKHKVITAVNLRNDQHDIVFHDTTEVVFHELSLAQITHYVEQYKPFDKAGAYAIQEWIGVVGIKEIHGDFYNVMGLPVSKVLSVLEDVFHYKLV